MKLKYLAWLLVVALAIAAGLLYNSNQQQAAELAQLRSDSQELEQLRTSQAGTNQSQTQAASDELTRLREENKDVLRLRNQIREISDQNAQLTLQAQTAQAQVQSVQAQAEATRTTAAQALAQAQQLESTSRTQAQIGTCVTNLRQIDAAIRQWAVDNRKPPGTRATAADIIRYLGGTMPPCPAGGVYNLGGVGVPTSCSFPAHAQLKGQ